MTTDHNWPRRTTTDNDRRWATNIDAHDWRRTSNVRRQTFGLGFAEIWHFLCFFWLLSSKETEFSHPFSVWFLCWFWCANLCAVCRFCSDFSSTLWRSKMGVPKSIKNPHKICRKNCGIPTVGPGVPTPSLLPWAVWDSMSHHSRQAKHSRGACERPLWHPPALLSGLPNANAKSLRFSYAISQITTLPPVVALNRSSKSQIVRCVLARSFPNRIGLFPLVPLNRSVLNRSVFKTQTQLNRKR